MQEGQKNPYDVDFEEINENEEIILDKVKRFSPVPIESLYLTFDSKYCKEEFKRILIALRNPAKNPWIRNELDRIINYLKGINPNKLPENCKKNYQQIIDFFEDENINVIKTLQGAKCNPFNAMHL